MSRILLSSLKYSHLKLGHVSAAASNRVLLKSLLPCASRSVSKCNYSTPAADLKDRSRDEEARRGRSATNARAQEYIDTKISRLDQFVKRLGRTSLRDVESTIRAIEKAGSVSATQSLMIIRSCGALLVEEKPEMRTQLAHRIWKLLKDFDVKLDISHYNALLRVYLENEYSFNPSDILRTIEDNGLEVNRVTCQRLINRYCQMGDIGNATRILEHMRQKGMPINESVFNALISGHSEVNDMESAENILTVMKESGLEPSAETYTLLMCGFIKNGNLEKVDQLFKQCESEELMFADKDYFDLIYAYTMHGYEDEIDKVLGKIRRSSSYNHDAMNFAFKLLTANKPEIAYKILKSMLRTSRSDGSLVPVGNFFISHLVRSNASADVVLKYSRNMMEENLNPRALHIAVENALRYHREELAFSLLEEVKDKDIFPIRPHYFWPLLVNRGKQGDISGMCEILVRMNRDFGLTITRETICDYVVPYVLKHERQVDKILIDLKSCNIPTPLTAGAIVSHLLQKGQMKRAVEVADNHVTQYSPRVARVHLLSCFYDTSDVNSFITILQDMISHIYWFSNLESESERSKLDHRDFAGETIGQAVEKLLEKNRTNVIQKLLQKVVIAGIGLNEGRIKYIQALVKGVVPDEIANSLEKLSSDEFATPSRKAKLTKFPMNELDEKSLERLYELAKTKGEKPHAHVQRCLFICYAKNRDLAKMDELKKELEADGFILNPTMLIYAMDAYVHKGELEEGLKIYQKLCDDDPTFYLNPKKTLALVDCLVEHDQYDKAVEILKTRTDRLKSENVIDEEENEFNKRLAVRILRRLSEKGDVEKTKELLDLFVAAKIVQSSNYLLGPIIRAYLERDDIDGAMKEFQNCVQNLKVTPLKNELARYFIEKEDTERLQQLIDLNSNLYGEANSLADLMFAFLESGRVKQAQKILETPGFRLKPDRLQYFCTQMLEKEDSENAIHMLAMTKNNALVDRELIYDTLLSIYGKRNEPQNSLSLWIEIQEEGLQPSDSFLLLLASILKRNDLDVPFVVPEAKQNKVGGKRSSSSSHLEKLDDPEGKRVSTRPMSKKAKYSELIKKLLEEDRYPEAKTAFQNLVAAYSSLPYHYVNLRLLQQALEKGDIDFFNYLEDKFTDGVKRKCSFNNRMLLAYSKAGRVDEYLSSLEKKLGEVQDKGQLKTLLLSYPRTAIVSVMLKHPEYKSRVEAFAEKCIAIGDESVMPNVLFSYHLIQKNNEKADQIWNEYLKNTRKLFIKPILVQIPHESDPQLKLKLLSYLQERPDFKDFVAQVYNNLIEMHVGMGEIKQAKEHLEEALTKIPISELDARRLQLLKDACLDKEIDFPYLIPVKKGKRTSSVENTDSDSD